MNNNTVRKIHLTKYPLHCLCFIGILWLCNTANALAKSATEQLRPLHQVVIQGDVGAVQHLLQEGVNVDSQDQKGRTPLVLAAARGYTPIMELLIKAGARVHGLHRNIPLSSAAMYGQVESMRMLISYGAKVNKMDHAGYTPLHSAVMVGHLAAIQLLLDHKAQQKRCRYDGKSPLHIAAVGEYKFAKQLFQHVIECEQTGNYDEAMHYNDTTCRAPEEEVLATVQCLLAHGANVNRRDDKGRTPLHYATLKQYPEVAQLLIEHGAEVNTIDENGEYPLHQAAAYKDTAIAQLLIENGADINCQSNSGTTPLLIAIVSMHPKMALFLVEKGANPRLGGGRGPISFAVDAEYESMMQPFILHYIKADKSSYDQRSIYEFTLYCIISTGSLPMAQLALAQKEVDVNSILVGVNTTLLGVAVRFGRTEMVKLLIDRGANVNAPVHARRKKRGKAPLHCAARLGHLAIAKLLIAHGADIDAKSSRGNTPLKYALKYQQKAMAHLLEEHGAVVN